MQIDIIGDKFQVNVYDKRDSFDFQVFRYPSIYSNIPDKTLYNVFFSQLVRFSRVCNNMDGFISALIKLKGRVLAKGANKKCYWLHLIGFGANMMLIMLLGLMLLKKCLVAIFTMVGTLGQANWCQARMIKIRLKFTTCLTDNLFGCCFQFGGGSLAWSAVVKP